MQDIRCAMFQQGKELLLPLESSRTCLKIFISSFCEKYPIEVQALIITSKGCEMLLRLFYREKLYILPSIIRGLSILVNILSTEKLEIELDADLMTKLKTKADATNKTPSETIAEILREQLK
jgi:hypothetical protein